MFCRSLFVLFLLASVLSVLIQFTDSDYHFGIFKLFLRHYKNIFIGTESKYGIVSLQICANVNILLALCTWYFLAIFLMLVLLECFVDHCLSFWSLYYRCFDFYGFNQKHLMFHLGPALELSTLGCSSTHNNTLCLTENIIGTYTSSKL